MGEKKRRNFMRDSLSGLVWIIKLIYLFILDVMELRKNNRITETSSSTSLVVNINVCVGRFWPPYPPLLPENRRLLSLTSWSLQEKNVKTINLYFFYSFCDQTLKFF